MMGLKRYNKAYATFLNYKFFSNTYFAHNITFGRARVGRLVRRWGLEHDTHQQLET